MSSRTRGAFGYIVFLVGILLTIIGIGILLINLLDH